MDKIFSFLVSVFLILAFVMPVDAASTKVRYIGGVIDSCFAPKDRAYGVIKNYKEFATMQDCKAYQAGLKGSTDETNDLYKYFDGVCYTLRDKKYVELTIYKGFDTKNDCNQAIRDRFKNISEVIVSNDNCTKQTYFNYSQKTILDCDFDLTDPTPITLNPSLGIKTQLSVVKQDSDSNKCILKAKNMINPNDTRQVLNCKYTPLGTHDSNLNLNNSHKFNLPFNPNFFRYSDVTISIGNSNDRVVKSGIYIADTVFSIQFRGSASSAG